VRQNKPVTRVVELLVSAGYRALKSPFTIASVPFDFAAVLVGSDRALDLIVVVDTLTDTEPRIRQKVLGLSRALDLVASRRPLTTILVGPPPRMDTLDSLAKVSRVLPVGSPSGPAAQRLIEDALAALLPLTLPDSSEEVVDPLAEVHRRLPVAEDDETVNALLNAAHSGQDAVRGMLKKIITGPLEAKYEGEEQ
jgi:hypothetical protein